MAVEGLISFRSDAGPAQTIERLRAELQKRGLTVFAEIDHAAGAAVVGLDLRPTIVVIFGNAKGGTPLMQAAQTVGIDLPLKALVWQDAHGDTWLGFNDPAWLAQRHGVADAAKAAAANMSATLAAVGKAAAASAG